MTELEYLESKKSKGLHILADVALTLIGLPGVVLMTLGNVGGGVVVLLSWWGLLLVTCGMALVIWPGFVILSAVLVSSAVDDSNRKLRRSMNL